MQSQFQSSSPRQLAVVTGASSGIGYNLARCCAENGFDLILAADQPLEAAASDCRALGATVETVQTELASREGVDELVALVRGRRVDALLANAGHGLGRAFLEQDFAEVQHVIDTNITGTIYLVQKVAKDMVAAGRGRVLITGSIAGFQPGAFQAVYNGTKAFIDSFAAALRNEIKDTGVTVTCLMPGATDTEFFARADMLDTKVAADKKALMDPGEVAQIGFDAMMDGEADVVAGMKNRMRVAMTKVTPSQIAAEQHRQMAEPGTAAKV
jgi:short-subunit dehydrogenase